VKDRLHRRVSRSLTQDEDRLLRWMIEHGGPEAEAYVEQLGRLRVVSECTCGCPTIDLALDDQVSSGRGGSLVIADAEGKSREGVAVNVIVHVREKGISELEVAGFDGPAQFSLPRPTDLRPW